MPFFEADIGDCFSRDDIHNRFDGRGNQQTSLVVSEGEFLFAAPTYGDLNPNAPLKMNVVGLNNAINAENANGKNVHLFWHTGAVDYQYFGRPRAEWAPRDQNGGILWFNFRDLLARNDFSLSLEFEGAPRLITHLITERSRAVRDRFIVRRTETQTLRCDACDDDLNYYDIPGQLEGRMLFEAHHNIPLAQHPGEHLVGENDFRLLCPNCHRAIHRTIQGNWGILPVETFHNLLPHPRHPH